MSRNRKNISLEISNNLHEKTGEKKQSNKQDIARRRWGILAKALKSPISSQPSSPTDEISMRRFSTFMLLKTEQIYDDVIEKQPIENEAKNHCQNDKNIINGGCYENNTNETKSANHRKIHAYSKRTWFRYSAKISNENFFVDVAHTARSFTAVDLMGFNNTGNVCVWPSEEALAFYALNNLKHFKGKKVLELGAGMSALAGLMIAKYASSKLVHLTDGNCLAVENIKSSLEKNKFDTIVTLAVLQWGTNDDEGLIYDIILSADCLFFDEARNDLIETICNCLASDGIAYVMAPKRGETLNIFVDHAEMRGFICRKMIVYDQEVWNRHLEYLDNPEADYWKSQAKKYCEFCRCWLADNKPSVEFHEKGRKHKENVARRLRTISKTSRREHKESIREDQALRRMESAALEAYRKDVEQGADISSKVIQEQLESAAAKNSTPWHEVASKEGPSYYWNTETNESLWEPPASGFLSIAEQKAEAFRKGKQQLTAVEKFKKKQDKLHLKELKQQQEEERAAAEREKMKARRVVEEEPVTAAPVVSGPILESSCGPYGRWKTVETIPRKNVDFQLPKQEEYVAISIPIDKPEPIKQFKEKTVTSLENNDISCASVSFKKRKFCGNKNRNVRQRLDND